MARFLNSASPMSVRMLAACCCMLAAVVFDSACVTQSRRRDITLSAAQMRRPASQNLERRFLRPDLESRTFRLSSQMRPLAVSATLPSSLPIPSPRFFPADTVAKNPTKDGTLEETDQNLLSIEEDAAEERRKGFFQRYRIRRATEKDLEDVAQLSARVFDREMLDDTVAQVGGSNQAMTAITKFFADIIYWIFIQDYRRNIKECLDRKSQLAPIARNQARSMTSKYMRYALTKQNDGRMFNVLIAEERISEKIVGTVTILRFPAEAILPPPMPTTKPKRLYASTLAVDPDYRRQGIARYLMAESEKLAERWGQDYLYLHVLKPNVDAQFLYFNLGYELVQEDPWWYVEKRYLLRKKMDDSWKQRRRKTASLPRMNI
mmetsp:Transcript_2141/g.4890  ORF Transcript_2141/g.4890 Transcript_2141/m.4890 type:complete len:377 (-) Transcript_2141:71-1201(-)